jgi:biopolymer transport protein ExbD
MLTSNSPNALDLLLPKAKGKSTNVQNVSVSIKKNLEIYIDANRVREGQIEAQLKAKLAGQDEPTIILRAEEGVPIEKAVNIMDIANKNKYKIILAVRPQ